MDIEQDIAIPDDIIGKEMNIMDGNIIAYITGNDQAVGYSSRNFQFMMLKDDIPEAADPDKAKEPGIFDLVGIKFAGHKDLIPIVGCIVVFHKSFHLI